MPRRKQPDLQITIEEVTPEMAKDWLGKNTFNRNKSEIHVAHLAEAMYLDEWRLNGEAIIFDSKGRLQNGQHRLWACIEAATSFTTVVIRGADSDAIFTIDVGRKRSLADALQLRGEKDVATLGNLLVWTWRWENGLMDQGGRSRPTNVSMLKLLDERPEIRDAITVGWRFRKALRAPSGLMCALWYQFGLIDQDDADFFLEQCVTGEDLSDGDPAFAWRRWMNARYLERLKPPQQVVAAITVKAWNGFRNHTTIGALRWAGNESFPEAI